MAILEANALARNYRLGKTVIHALRGVSLQVQAKEFVAIAGPSGSGKTTLLNLLGCIDEPSSGTLTIDGLEVSRFSSNQRAELRYKKLGFIFQSFNLIPVLTAFENVEYPLLKRKMSSNERRERATESLRQVGLSDHLEHRPEELSGGQRQRVAIARALVGEPAIILADEPTANLDQQTGAEILEMMKKINQDRGTVFIFSTHDPKIMEMAHRVINMRDGRIIHPSPLVGEGGGEG
jgi:putative ABC transport system ATP-binding protein